MKPKPFWLLNHFTVPVFIGSSLLRHASGSCRASATTSCLFDYGEGSERAPSVKRRSGPVVRPNIDRRYIEITCARVNDALAIDGASAACRLRSQRYSQSASNGRRHAARNLGGRRALLHV